MSNAALPNRFPAILWVVALAATLGVIIVAGFSPKDYRFRNEVAWASDGPGLVMGRYGLAYARPFVTREWSEAISTAGFTIEIAFEPGTQPTAGFAFLAAFHDGDDGEQLVVGTWRDHIIVMNGDDYRNKRGLPRIAARFCAGTTTVIAVTTGEAGTRLFINGKAAQRHRGLMLTVPGEAGDTTLVLGNSVYGHHPLEGAVRGMTVFDRALPAGDIERHHADWLRSRNFSFASADDPHVLYALDEGAGHVAGDASPRHLHLQVPPQPGYLERRTLGLPDGGPLLNRDFLLNLAGFVPFGFLLGVLLSIRKSKRPGQGTTIVGVVLSAGFLLSLVIELSQAWMPSRASSALDLALNSAGTLAGALLSCLASRINGVRNGAS